MTSIEKSIGFKFRKKKLLKTALTHPSCFFADNEEVEPASLSMLVSAFTTIVAFAPLLVSDTPLLRAVGACIGIGVTAAAFTAPLVVNFRKH